MEQQRELRVARRGNVCLVLIPCEGAGLEGTELAQGQGTSGERSDVRGPSAKAGRGDEKECVVTVRIAYTGELPEGIAEILAQRAYDAAHARGKNVRARVRATVVEEA